MALAPGSPAGPYRVVEQLGRGGMASVYKAYEAALDRYVALKVLPREFLHDPTFAERFRREAQVIARLEHPNIIPIYAFDIEQEEGIPWMAMRLIAGGALSALLKRGPLALPRAVAIVRGVADALDYAHGKGVVHRDVKPHNILLDEAGRVYLADFGIAKIVEGSGGVTVTGMITGTPQYMAPEQATATKVDRRTDIYSLGIVAYEMFTGRVPFSADTPLAILMKHLQEPIPLPPPSAVPEPLTRALLKGLAKKPEDRWGTASAFVAALEDGLTRSLAAGRPPGPTVGLPVVSSSPPLPAAPVPRVDSRPVLPGATPAPWPAPRAAGGRRVRLLALLALVSAVAAITTRPDQFPWPSLVGNVRAWLAGWARPFAPGPPTAPPTIAAAAVTSVPEPTRPTAPAVSPVVQGLLDGLAARDAGTRWRSAEALGNLGSEALPALTALAEALRDKSPEVRWRSAEAIGKIGPEAKEAVPALAAAIKDGDTLVRGEAAKALGSMGAHAAEAVPALGEGLRSPQVAFRREAAKALARIGAASRPAVSALVKALRDKDRFVRSESAKALGRIGPDAQEAVPALRVAARDPDLIVAREAAVALKRIASP